MRTFACDACETVVDFAASACAHCGTDLGYAPDRLDVTVIGTTDQPGTFDLDDGSRWRRCLNAAWGCNWLVPADGGQTWCASCALTRGRPAIGDLDAIEAWAATEADKRRLVHDVATLGLPIGDDLVFDLVHVPGEPAVTGYSDGVVTIDLTERDDSHREHVRRSFGERARTMLGHLRHELGHHYWPRLVGGQQQAEFRHLFGDERLDYRNALAAHHADASVTWDAERHISRYASAHPSEDWAETFAHLLLIRSAFEAATCVDLVDRRDADPELPFDLLLDRWVSLAAQLDTVAAAIGNPPAYPFRLTAAVVEKLRFVDRCVAAARDGWRGGAPPAPAQDPPAAGLPRCDAIHAGRRCALEVRVGSTWCASHGPADTEA